jgi:hypothetical protein
MTMSEEQDVTSTEAAVVRCARCETPRVARCRGRKHLIWLISWLVLNQLSSLLYDHGACYWIK